MIRFCTTGIWATSISTPKSPRATMIASADLHDLVELVERFLLFDLGDDAGLASRCERRMSFRARTSSGAAHEAQADEVDARLRRPNRVLMIGVAHRRHAQLRARQIDALPAANRAPLHDPCMNSPGLFAFDDHA